MKQFFKIKPLDTDLATTACSRERRGVAFVVCLLERSKHVSRDVPLFNADVPFYVPHATYGEAYRDTMVYLPPEVTVGDLIDRLKLFLIGDELGNPEQLTITDLRRFGLGDGAGLNARDMMDSLITFGDLYLRDRDVGFPWFATHCWDGIDKMGNDIGDYDVPWQLREKLRFATGCYKPVPWEEELPVLPEHYAHVSTRDPSLVAFTENPEKGKRDIQTSMKPGRYLTRFYKDLDPDRVREIQAKLCDPASLRFASTPDEIEKVYKAGPQSCMSYSDEHYQGHCHPVRVYGNSDLKLAYMTDNYGRPNARALVWPERKVYGRMYGDEDRLRIALKAAGYSSGSLVGAKIRRIKDASRRAERYIMPYIDAPNEEDRSFDEHDDQFFVIGGDYPALNTDGTAVLEPAFRCECCDESSDPDEAGNVTTDDGDQRWCDSCVCNNSFTCDNSGERLSSNDFNEVEVIVRRTTTGHVLRQTWCEEHTEDQWFYCDATHENYASRSFDAVEMRDGETWVNFYFREHGVEVDGANWSRDEAEEAGLLNSDEEAA